MAGIQDHWEYVDDFFGTGSLQATAAGGDRWDITDTSSAGTPTYAYVDGAATGEVQLAFSNTNEIQNVCLSHGDTLGMDIDKIQRVMMRVKMNQASIDATTSVAFGLTGDRNDAIDSIAQAALFRLVGADSTTAVVVETDDGTNNNDDVATGETLINAYKKFVIDFTQGTSDVRFYIDGKRVAASTTFDMSNYTGSLQPFVQLQKTADTNTDGLTIDYFAVYGTR